jgi:hypothetical protein
VCGMNPGSRLICEKTFPAWWEFQLKAARSPAFEGRVMTRRSGRSITL